MLEANDANWSHKIVTHTEIIDMIIVKNTEFMDIFVKVAVFVISQKYPYKFHILTFLIQ